MDISTTLFRKTIAAIGVACCLASTSLSGAISANEGVITRDFEPTGTWELFVDGQLGSLPSVWSSADRLHFLVAIPPDGHLVFLSPRRQKGLDLEVANVVASPVPNSGNMRTTLPVESNATFPLDITSTAIAFTNRGHHVEFRRTRDIVGPVECAELLRRFPEMLREYETYTPDLAAMEDINRLVPASRLQIAIYLGTWCGHSLKDVPRILRVVDGLAQTVKPQCIGVSVPVEDDAAARAAHITEVPVILGSARSSAQRRANPGELERPENFILRVLRQGM
jgi:hypothetical protein